MGGGEEETNVVAECFMYWDGICLILRGWGGVPFVYLM